VAIATQRPRDEAIAVPTNQNRLSRALPLATIGLFQLAIIPFVIVARFAHPSYDDWCFAERTRTLGFWEAAKFWYAGWTGRFTAIAVMNLTPVSPPSHSGYKLVPVMLLAGLYLALFWLAVEVLRERVRARAVAVFCLGVLAVFLYRMASPAEGFYWYNGASVTTWGSILALAMFAAAIRSQRGRSSAAAWGWAAIAGVLAALAAGINEVVLLLLGLILVVLAWVSRRDKVARWHLWLVPLTLAAAAGVFDVLAPGNAKRAAATGGLSRVVGPFLGSAAFSAATVIEWLSSAPLLVGALAIFLSGVAASSQIPAGSPWRTTSWRLPPLVAAAGVWGAFFFTHWASGFAFRPGPPDRVINVALLFFLVLVILSVFMAGIQLSERFRSLVSELRPPLVHRWLVLVVAVMLFGDGNVRQAYEDLITGRAATYDRELNERDSTLRAASHRGEAVTVPPLSRIPKTILFKDITADPAHPHNQCYARFWDVPQVRVQ
jgi:hypothetical protein